MNRGLLNTISLTSLHGIGASQSEKMRKIGLNTVQDLLLHFPLRYEDHTRLYHIKDLMPGTTATITGEVLQTKVVFGRKRMMTCLISDGTGNLTLRFFNFSAAMKNSLAEGRQVTAYGEVRRGNTGPEIIHPEYKVSQEADNVTLQENLTPVYPTTEGVRQATLRKVMDQAIAMLDSSNIQELLPEEFSRSLISLPDAIRLLHNPPPDVSLDELEKGHHPAQKRLILEELLAHHLSMLAIRAGNERLYAEPLISTGKLKTPLLANLPFSPTNAQNALSRKSKLIYTKMRR